MVYRLERELGLSELIVAPRGPHDPISHSDGMVALLDGRTVNINDFSVVSPFFRRRIRGALKKYEIDLVELPYEPQSRDWMASRRPQGTGRISCWPETL